MTMHALPFSQLGQIFSRGVKVLSLLAMGVLITSGMAVVAYGTGSVVRRQAAPVARSHDVIASLDSVLAILTDMQASVRGYVISGEKEFLRSYESATESIHGTMRHTATLVRDQPDQSRRIEHLARLVRQRVQSADAVMKLRRAADLDWSNAGIGRGGDGRTQEAIVQMVSEMTAAESESLKQQRVDEANNWQQTMAALAAGSLLSAVLTAVALVLLQRDFYGRRKAIAARRDADSQLQAVLNAMPVAVLAVDKASGRLVLANDFACRMFGYRHDEMMRMAATDLIPAAEYERVTPKLARAMNGEAPLDEAIPLARSDGSVILADICNCLIHIAERPCLLSLFTDTTERRRVEDALQKSEERLRLAQAGAKFGVWDWDLESGKLDWTQELEHIYGFVKGDFSGTYQDFSNRVHRDDLAEVERERDEAVRTHQSFDVDFRVITLSGETLWLNSKGSAVYDETGRPVRIVGVNIDITEGRRAQRLLKRLQEEQQLILDSVPAMIWYKDTRNRILRVNAVTARSLGLSREQIEGKPTAEFYPEEADRYFRDDLMVVQTGLPRLGIEEPYRLPSGEVRWIQTDKVPLKDDSGRVTRLLVMALDITDRKRLEEEAELHIEQLREADRRKDEFLAMLGHELRNPLTPLRHAAEILQSRGQDPATVRWCRDMIDRQVTHLTRLVDDLLDVARINRGQIKLQKQPLELAEVMEAAVEASKPLMASRRHELSIQLPKESLRVEADPVRLTQIVANLLTNAANYTAEAGCIAVIVEPWNEVAVIRVRDNGRGIDPEELNSVFDMFYQAKTTFDRTPSGLGIGLSLVRSLVSMHGGDAQAFSEGPGRGSEFVVSLPRLLDQQASLSPDASKTALPRGGRRILVVDDNYDAAKSLALLLRNLGHQVLIAYDGATALETARTEQPEFIVLDINLPGIDGYAVARSLRQYPEFASTRIVALTGYGQKSDREKAIDAGFDRFLTKPVKLHDLLESLNLGPN